MQSIVGKTWVHLAASALLLPCIAMAQPASGAGTRNGNGQRVKLLAPITPISIDVDVRTLPDVKPWHPGQAIKDARGRQYRRPGESLPHAPVDKRTLPDRLPELQQIWDASEAGRRAGVRHKRMRAGRALIDNPGTTGGGIADPVVEVGANHVIYGARANSGNGNATFTIYDKTGALVSAQKTMASLAPSNSACAADYGDPLVIYDRLADRWFMQAMNENRLCIYVSKTSNPVTGGWWLYQVSSITSQPLPDFPKCGVWPSAYVCTTMQPGQPVYILDRERMLAGQTARNTQTLLGPTPALTGYGFQTITPATLYGNTVPAGGVKPLLARHRDDEAHDGAQANGTTDYIELFELTVDWVTPGNTRLTVLPRIAITEYNSWFKGYSGYSVVPQPDGTNNFLDVQREVIFNPLVYRHMGTYEAIVGTFATNQNSARTGTTVDAGLRWFELRRTGGGDWVLHQEGTFGPGDSNTHHFLGTIGMDRFGNIGLAYSLTKTSTPKKYASLLYTGRTAADPNGVMSLGETEVATGGGIHTGGRWGDYHQMTVDPVDDCTFWFVGMYRPSGAAWATRIADFRFPACGGTPPTTYSVSGTVTGSGGAALPGVSVSNGSTSVTTNASGVYTFSGLGNGGYTLTPSLSGYTFSPVNRSVSVNGANVSGQNFTGTASGGGSAQLLLNPGFESGATNWTASHTGIISNSTQRPARTGSWYARLGGVGSTATRTAWQSVSIPSGRTSATLSYYLRIDTAESATATSVYDRLEVQVLNSAGTSVLRSCTSYSNRDAGTAYVQRTCDLSAQIGQTVRIQFKSTEDSSLQTSFVIDDAALTVQ
jgi:hypothetical protein